MTTELTLEPLDKSEKTRWRTLWKRVKTGREQIWNYMDSISEIRDKSLWRNDFSTFDSFLENEVSFHKNHVYKMLVACQTRQNLTQIATNTPQLNIIDMDSASHLRELSDVDDDDLPVVLEDVSKRAGEKPVTARVIKAAVKEFNEQQFDEDPEEPAEEYEDEGPSEKKEVKTRELVKKSLIDQIELVYLTVDDYHHYCENDELRLEVMQLLHDVTKLVKGWK